jgi:predicted  nucleic acid-binding Zn-ribbon protein
MNETDYRNLILVYQQKVSDFLSQAIALEAKVLTLNQNVEILKKKIQEQEVELEKLSTKKKTTTQKVDNLSAEEF